MKKAAIMLYPMFSIQEISCTTELFKFYDKDIITFSAGGDAFREFAAAVARKAGIDCPEAVFSGVTGQTFTEEDCTYHMPPEMMPEIRADWDRILLEAEKFLEEPY